MDRRAVALAVVVLLNLTALLLIIRFVPSDHFLLWYASKDTLALGSIYFIANKKIDGVKPLPLIWRIAANASLPLMLMH